MSDDATQTGDTTTATAAASTTTTTTGTTQTTDVVTQAVGADDKAATTAARPADQTVTGDKTGDTPKVATWPDDWRVQLAGTDDKDGKRLKALERFASPQALADAQIEVRDKIARGELRAPAAKLAADATPEQVAEYRKANGIPETPDKYDTSLPGGVVLGEDVKPIVDSFLKTVHGHNWSPEHVKQGLAWWHAHREQEQDAQTVRDGENSKAAVDDLREQYGADYRTNIALYKGWLDSLPDGIGEALNVARDSEGRLFGANPKWVNWVVGLVREMNPIATVVPGSGNNSQQALESEMETIRKLMGNENSEYWKGPKSEKLQARYRELLEVQERVGKRAA